MKKYLILLIILLSSTSCILEDYESEHIKSSSGKYSIKTTVERTNVSSKNYAEVMLHLYNYEKRELDIISTGAADFSKWAIGWTTKGDTIVMQSSDIGNRAWIVLDNKIIEIDMTQYLNNRAEELKDLKYNQ